MSDAHPVHYIVKAQRNNIVVHLQEATSREDAERLKARFEGVPHTQAEIVAVHDRAETDLTTHTREIVDTIAKQAQN